MELCNCSMFCYTLLYVQSSIAIILMGKRELVALLNLSSWCLVMVKRLFLVVPRVCLRFVIVIFPDHTHLLFFRAMAVNWKKLQTSIVFLLFIVCWNRNRSALVRELLSNNSLFVGQLYEDKSLTLCALDLIFFTTDLQTVNYYTTIHC